MLVAARLDRITRRAHTLSGLLKEGYAIRAADTPGADDLMMRIYTAMAQKERELISERTRAVLGGDRGYQPPEGPSAAAAPQARRVEAERAANRLVLEVEQLQSEGVTGEAVIARELTERGVPTPKGGAAWTTQLPRGCWRGCNLTARLRPPRRAMSGPTRRRHTSA